MEIQKLFFSYHSVISDFITHKSQTLLQEFSQLLFYRYISMSFCRYFVSSCFDHKLRVWDVLPEPRTKDWFKVTEEVVSRVETAFYKGSWIDCQMRS